MRQVGRTGLAFQAGGIALIAAGLIGCDEGGADPEPELPAFPTFWQSWSPASEPAGPAALGLDREYQRPLPYSWYNPERVVRRRDVFLETRDQSEGEEFLRVLEFAIATERSGDWASPDSSGWFGVMRQLPPDLQDLREATSVAIGRGWLDTEDIDPEDGELTASREDFGLDNIQAADSDPPAPGDDGNDDFVLPGQEPLDYSRINGTEGNGLLDTEDLDGNDFLDQDNIYGSYVISLGEDPVSPRDTPSGWSLRSPLVRRLEARPGQEGPNSGHRVCLGAGAGLHAAGPVMPASAERGGAVSPPGTGRDDGVVYLTSIWYLRSRIASAGHLK
jgi:hypothetical protein